MTKQSEALEKAEKYYSRLVTGKSLEKRVSIAISEYAVARARNQVADRRKASFAIYLPEVDINGIDFVLRIEMESFVHLLEVQVKTTRNGLQLSESIVGMAQKYNKSNSAFIVVCCREPEKLVEIKQIKCFHSWDISESSDLGRHISASAIDSMPSLDEVLETLIEAMA